MTTIPPNTNHGLRLRESKSRYSLRITWAITAKDLVDGLKNKTTLSVLLSILFLVVFYKYLPMLELLADEGVPTLLVYDAGSSALITALENSATVNTRTYPSEDKLRQSLANESQLPELGLVIPADFDQIVAVGGTPEIQGYVLHWVSTSEAEALKQTMEAHLAELAGVPVRIRLEVYIAPPEADGLGISVGIDMIFAALLIGIAFVPNLMFEEKRTKTLEALLVSPAGPVEVTLAKALTGLIYCLLTFAVVFAVYSALVVQWWLAITTAIVGSLFVVSLGLVLGASLENRQQLMLWAWFVIIPLVLPLLLVLVGEQLVLGLLPVWLVTAFHWIPSAAMLDLLRASFSNQSQIALWGPPLALVLAWTIPILAGVAWLVRESER
jgi:ABC-type Na+ efflux pump permease subunit